MKAGNVPGERVMIIVCPNVFLCWKMALSWQGNHPYIINNFWVLGSFTGASVGELFSKLYIEEGCE